MSEKRTPHLFWLIATILCFLAGGPILAAISGVCWVCSAGRTKKHNAKLTEKRHNEVIAALRNH